MCHASKFFLQRHRGGAADSRVKSAESSSSTVKTKAEGVLRLGPNGRQVHIVKDQKAIRTLKAKSRLHTGSAGLQEILAVFLAVSSWSGLLIPSHKAVWVSGHST